MGARSRPPLEPRKKPVQARSAVTVATISEATIQVLLSLGADQLTTTRVAERAGVSVGTLYQYFPNKHALLFSVLQQHLNRVADAVESACRENRGEGLATMVEAVVRAFVDAKMAPADISMALYAIAAGREEAALVKKTEKRAQVALASMLATAPDAIFDDLSSTSFGVFGDGWRHASDSRRRSAPWDGALAAKAVGPALSRIPDEHRCRGGTGRRRRFSCRRRKGAAATTLVAISGPCLRPPLPGPDRRSRRDL
jgi:AcrR family transcriptional regulator